MKYFSFLFFIFSTMLIMLFSNYGYAFLKSLKYDALDFSILEKVKKQLSLKLLWSHKVGCGGCGYCVNLYPACKRSYVFIVDYYGVVKKLHLDTGRCIWSRKLSDVFFSKTCFKHFCAALFSCGVSVSQHSLYLGSELAKVYALDINTGATLWVSEVSGEVISKPIISRGLVLVYTSNGVFQALDVKSGIIRWSINFKIPAFSFRVTLLPVISDDIVILGDSGDIISACYVDTGELIWQKRISSLKGFTDIDRLSDIIAPVVIDNVIYAVSYNGDLVALDIFSGNLIWLRSIGSLTNIIVEDDCLYLIDQDRRVVALNKFDGSVVWSKSDLMYNQLISIALYKDYILLGDVKGYLYCLYKKDGVFLGRKMVAVTCFKHLTIVDNKIIFYENNGTFSVWNLVNRSSL